MERMTVRNPIVVDVNRVIAGRATIAGGAIRSCFQGVNPKDIDIFMLSANMTDYDTLCRELYEEFVGSLESISGYEEHRDNIMYEEGNYYSFDFYYKDTPVVISVITPQVMFGRNTYGTPKQIIEEIDLSVCRFGLNEDNTLWIPKGEQQQNVTDIGTKQMHLVTQRGVEELERTAKRLQKYEEYGYTLVLDSKALKFKEALIEFKETEAIKPKNMFEELFDA